MDLGLIFARLFRFQDYLRHPQKNNKLRSNCKSNTPNLPYNIILEKTMSNKELFDNYKDYLANNDYLGANTKYAYICDVKFYMTFLEGMDVSKAEPGTIIQLIRHMKSIGRANVSIYRMIVSVRNFYKYLKQEKIVESNPVKDFSTRAVNEILEP